MANLFGLPIDDIINREIAAAGGVLDATLIVVTEGTRDPAALTGGTMPTDQSLACKGFIDDYLERAIDESIIRTGDRRITILGSSVPGKVPPKPTDRITIEGDTYTIINVARDPAAATYACQSRG